MAKIPTTRTKPSAAFSLPGAWLLTPSWPAVAFALRTTATSLIALAIAFLMDMDEPRWAATTVWIVAQPQRGMSLSKARFRILGTLVGAAVALFLSATCIQTPELFLTGLALWIGACTLVATLLRNFRAYGAVLAGYTAVIIAIGAAAQPENVFEVAISRLIYVLLGIICETLVTSVLAPGSAERGLDQKVRDALAHVAAASAQALRGGLKPGAQMTALVAEINALDTVAEYAAAVSSDVDRHLGHVRQIMASMLLQISSAHSTSRRIAKTPLYFMTYRWIADLQAKAWALFDDLPRQLARRQDAALLERVHALRQTLHADRPLPDEANDAHATQTRFLLDRLEIMLRSLEECLIHLIGLRQRRVLTGRGRAIHHRDLWDASINGVRAAIAVGLASIFWIVTAWPQGGTFVVIVAVVCALFATREKPAAGSLAFLRGTAIAAIPAFLCNFLILPHMSGFEMLVLGIGPFLFLAGLAYFSPHAGMAAAAAIFFWDMTAPDNLTRQTATGYFNSVVALLLSMSVASLVFNVILPPDPATRRYRLLRAIVDDLPQPLRDPLHSTHAWSRRLGDRIARARSLTSTDPASERVFANMLAALDLGLATARLARLRDEGQLPDGAHAPVDATLERLAHVNTAPGEAALAAHSAADALASLLPVADPDPALSVARALEIVREIVERIDHHPDLFAATKRPALVAILAKADRPEEKRLRRA